jgi:hypothetical protein
MDALLELPDRDLWTAEQHLQLAGRTTSCMQSARETSLVLNASPCWFLCCVHQLQCAAVGISGPAYVCWHVKAPYRPPRSRDYFNLHHTDALLSAFQLLQWSAPELAWKTGPVTCRNHAIYNCQTDKAVLLHWWWLPRLITWCITMLTARLGPSTAAATVQASKKLLSPPVYRPTRRLIQLSSGSGMAEKLDK